MTDELDLLRAADPVSATEGPWRDRPLDARAERGLNQLLYTSRRRARRRVVLCAEAAVAALAAVLVLTLPDLAATSATAAPSALRPRAGSAAVPLAEVAERARAAARDGEPELRRGSHIQTWSLAMDAGPHAERPVTLPEEREVRWRADGSRTERVESGGDLVGERILPSASSDAPPGARPPHTPGKLRAYLTEAYDGGLSSRSGPLTADQLLDTLPQLLDTWTLGAREQAALARVLAGTEGLRPAGAVTDRLGRAGQAYVHESADPADEALRRMLILDPGTGAVLGLEVMFTKAQPWLAVRAGDVMSYSAWRRD
ncbi:CU044_5270 family protein [Streptomyces spectabilis]|uniref:2-oxoglutarate dehydrogenase n=1 Tax=Streptomyces spectabilis TaxID=68270 RepID=A0A5P2X9L9_STRST|nr:CU044_5270 family protein [Streptomyces spectabilis]MBB5103790.1 hypothetical protein [Streptomyces spectabilis]MCI3903970.1 CU044_5270 family protein [Streptomyces spectabilis]QEV61121.1 hypothetical protein CP982_22415 [Streptomyces spectabilis]GGV18751.1 hypothetical protein GCM10010245_31750 [Streptomyces spectabilis]